MIDLLIVAGARPNFIKIAPIVRECDRLGISYEIVHTGQHYDYCMSDVFFKDLSLPTPNYNLDVGSNTHALTTAKIIERFETVLFRLSPKAVIVVGDVDSTMACAIVVSKLDNVKLIHIEAGGRSFDKSMPEEINRVITDTVSDILFTIDDRHKKHLLRENISTDRIYVVGDIIIDNLLYMKSRIPESKYKADILLTIHRKSNIDLVRLENILRAVSRLSTNKKVLFPAHPRTLSFIKAGYLDRYLFNVNIVEPLGYAEMLSELMEVSTVLTDSGGLPIEAAFLNKPVIMLRNNTERESLLRCGVVSLVDDRTDLIVEETLRAIGEGFNPVCNDWSLNLDGKVSERIMKVIIDRVL